MWRSACNSTGCLCFQLPHRIGNWQRQGRHIFVQASLQGSKLLQEAEAWPDLPLHEAVYGKTEAVRVRQHVNPLKKELQVPLAPPDWAAIYPDTDRPLIVDVGCGSGRFLLALSRRFQHHNLLGLDIRSKLMDRANEWATILELHESVHFMMANATVSLESMLATYPGPLSLVTVQFPDPHFKTRHKKRRVVQPQLARAIARMMPRGGRVFLQSDVGEAVADMHHTFRQHARAEFDVDLTGQPLSEENLLQDLDSSASSSCASASEYREVERAAGSGSASGNCSSREGSQWPAGVASKDHCTDTPPAAQESDSNDAGCHSTTAAPNRATAERKPDDSLEVGQYVKEHIQWLPANPLGVPTEREIHTLQEGGHVFRSLFIHS